MMLPEKRKWFVHNLAEFLEKFDAYDLFEKEYKGKFDEDMFDGYDGSVIHHLLDLIDGFYNFKFVENNKCGDYFEIWEYNLSIVKMRWKNEDFNRVQS